VLIIVLKGKMNFPNISIRYLYIHIFIFILFTIQKIIFKGEIFFLHSKVWRFQ